MKRIACFCIPAHGHHNPMLPVAAELVRRGDAVISVGRALDPASLCALGFGLHLPFVWALGVAAGVAVGPLGKRVQERAYKKLVGRELP